MCKTGSTRAQISLDDWLADPLIRLIMQADGIDPSQIRHLYSRLAARPADRAEAGDAQRSDIGPERVGDFRPGVGIMLLNRYDHVFVGRRTRTPGEAWQMPQGGIDDGEDARTAALRELREEIGTENVEILAEGTSWLRYELPPELIGKAWNGRWRGQQQKWFAMRFLGSDSEINIATEHPEFSAWRWVPASDLPDLIVTFKRQLYLDVLEQLRVAQTSVQDQRVVQRQAPPEG
jgi:putative (di)nucleoside polyphosphate hydrolase